MRLAIGSDEAGLVLKNRVKEYLEQHGYEFSDFGVHDESPVMYPVIAIKVATEIAAGEFDRGILVCGTGIGMAIAANKVKGIRAAICHDAYSAERAIKSNNAQIMTMGQRVIGEELALKLVEIWIQSDFEGGKSAAKVDSISEYEQN